MSFAWFVARRYLTARRRQAFISLISPVSILGVGVGVMALIIALALMTGVQARAARPHRRIDRARVRLQGRPVRSDRRRARAHEDARRDRRRAGHDRRKGCSRRRRAASVRHSRASIPTRADGHRHRRGDSQRLARRASRRGRRTRRDGVMLGDDLAKTLGVTSATRRAHHAETTLTPVGRAALAAAHRRRHVPASASTSTTRATRSSR